MSLLPMDYALLRYLVDADGSAPSIAIPPKLFAGEIPDDAPNLVESGLIEHRGDRVCITAAGRLALSSQDRA
jgi:hypothetical protein